MITSKKLTIFEGPDGSGKSYAAQRYAAETGALYVHFGPFKSVTVQLPRFFVEGMLPALQGYQEVVMDRCWYSEQPYGDAYRGGTKRINQTQLRALERVAYRCATVVVLCMPPWETVKSKFGEKDELLENVEQLDAVYESYCLLNPRLPIYMYDYTKSGRLDRADLDEYRSEPHPLVLQSAGNLKGEVMIVGDSFSGQRDMDMLYQWPFGALGKSGSSRFITAHLEEHGINEDRLFWINADNLVDTPRDYSERFHSIVALGAEAVKGLQIWNKTLPHFSVEHPAAWKRFKADQEYPLGSILKKVVEF